MEGREVGAVTETGMVVVLPGGVSSTAAPFPFRALPLPARP